MAELMDDLEQRITNLRRGVRQSLTVGDRAKANRLRAELRRVESEWETALGPIEEPGAADGDGDDHPTAQLLPVREQVHQALTFLEVPAAPKLIVALHSAIFASSMSNVQLTSLRRDEERSFKTSPYGRPYYICAALTADRLSPARGLLAISTWPMATRMVGPLSPRVHFLTAAIRVAEHLHDPDLASLPTLRLLWQFAANIPGGAKNFDQMSPDVVARAAMAELTLHQAADRTHREAAARRAVKLPDLQQMFGTTLAAAKTETGE